MKRRHIQERGFGETPARPPGRQRGVVLLLGILVSILILVVTLAAVSNTITVGKQVQYTLDRTRSLSVAEGTTEAAQKLVLDMVSNFEKPALSGSVKIGGENYPYTITPIGSAFNQTDPDGVTRVIQHYQISASTNVGDGYATVDRIVDLSMTPLFQYMIFYDDDLEILPGPSMTLGGRVHANGSIYVGSGATLTVDTDYFRGTGDILRRRKNDNSESTGTVNIRVKETTTYKALTNAQDAEYSNWTTFAIDTWQGTVQDGSHGVKEVAAPDIKTIKAFNPDGSEGFFHANADLVIKDNLAYDKSGNLLPVPAGTITEKSMYDAREGKTIKVTEINIGLLNTSGIFPENGLIYAYRTDAKPSQPNGIRLVNGTQILKPMSLVSQDPVYIQGDFNTIDKKGTAVIADAVNLLSNAWNDKKTPSSPLPAASNTTYNLAFITGKVRTPDGGGNYSGGFENLPRFHENWTGKTAKIRGAFVNLYESEIARGKWKYGGNVYTAPTRDWQYDPDLNDPKNLPPFTPNAVYFQRVVWDDRLPLPFVSAQ